MCNLPTIPSLPAFRITSVIFSKEEDDYYDGGDDAETNSNEVDLCVEDRYCKEGEGGPEGGGQKTK